MARKRESLLDLLTEVPWWASVVFAAVVYVGMRFVLPSVNFSNIYLNGISKGLPNIAWFFGLIFLLLAPVSIFKRWQRRHLFNSQRDISTVRSLHWNDFELLIGEAFRRQGYTVEERGGSAPDGGVDLVLRKDGQKTLVQCKHWKSQQVGVPIVRELLGAMTAQSASGGIVVTAGDYTSEARTFARNN